TSFRAVAIVATVIGLPASVGWNGSAITAQPRPAAPSMLFTGARVITGESGAPIEDGVFLVENGRISRVGRRGDVVAPASVPRVDLTGQTVIPALVDGHS